MDISVHQQVLLSVFALALIMGMVVSQTNFCTLGALSDWINIGDTGRLRSWLLAIATAMLGVAFLEMSGKIDIANGTFPPYRTTNFSWLRYLLGGLMFGTGMTLASGCGNKMLVRIGGGNLKSLVVLIIAAACAYTMMWTEFYALVLNDWIIRTTIDLAAYGKASQTFGDLIGISNSHLGVAGAAVLLVFVFRSPDFRASRANIGGGLVVGATVVLGWYLTGSAMGQVWKEFADFAEVRPLRVEAQSFTFISPMGDLARYLLNPGDLALVNFGIVALVGVVTGALAHRLVTRSFRVEWFASANDFLRHVGGAILLGVGGVLAMGCTVGQGITGLSTMASGSLLTLLSISAGSVATMKIQYWLMLRGS